MTPEMQFLYECEMRAFDRMPKDVREAIREYDLNIECTKLARKAKTAADMLSIIESGKAPVSSFA